MARQARSDVFDSFEVSAWHCINRCVRRCFLCGTDSLTGKNFDHRKTWLEDRFRLLAGLFGIDLLGFAILANHFHLILRNRPDVVATWSDDEVARRWLLLCPLRKNENGDAERPTTEEIRSITKVPERLTEIRRRLSDISAVGRNKRRERSPLSHDSTPRSSGIFATDTSAPLPPELRGMNELRMETALAACSGLL